MTIQGAMAMMLAMATSGWGRDEILVYVKGGNINSAVLAAAEDTASRILAEAGVQIAWRFRAPHSQAVVVNFSEHTAPEDHPGAMAYARPYEGIHVVVLYDRMQKVQGRLRAVLLGHVLAHELTHILQAVPRHSATGVMKAHWDSDNYGKMLKGPLPLTAEDIEMIRRGIEARKFPQGPPALVLATSRSPE